MVVSKNQVNKAADIYLEYERDQGSKSKALEIIEY